MARKKRRFEQVKPAAAAPEGGNKPVYQDKFQQTLTQTIENAGKRFEGQGRNILYILAAGAVLAVVVWIFMSWSERSNAEAQFALAMAIKTSQAEISETPPAAGSDEKTFKSQRERAESAIAEFQAVADKFGGPVGEKARYFIALNRLTVDRNAGLQELETRSAASGEVGQLSKFALAQARVTDGQYDSAVSLYQELAALSDLIIPKETINFELASVFEKQGRTDEAVNVLFDLVKAASEAKDKDGKSVPLSSTARSAKDKLEQLAPEKAKEIPEPEPSFEGLQF